MKDDWNWRYFGRKRQLAEEKVGELAAHKHQTRPAAQRATVKPRGKQMCFISCLPWSSFCWASLNVHWPVFQGTTSSPILLTPLANLHSSSLTLIFITESLIFRPTTERLYHFVKTPLSWTQRTAAGTANDRIIFHYLCLFALACDRTVLPSLVSHGAFLTKPQGPHFSSTSSELHSTDWVEFHGAGLSSSSLANCGTLRVWPPSESNQSGSFHPPSIKNVHLNMSKCRLWVLSKHLQGSVYVCSICVSLQVNR